jgi:hypothetical protein
MKKSSIAVGLIVGAGLALAAGQGAGAATLYDNANYTGASFSSSYAPNVGSLNDRASSIINGTISTYYEDAGFLGRSTAIGLNWNNLSTLSPGLGLFETWNDRISSFR